MKAKKNGLTREQAMELYRDLQNNMALLLQRQKNASAPKGSPARQAKAGKNPEAEALGAQIGALLGGPAETQQREGRRGAYAAIACVLFFAAVKVVLSAMESSGFATATPAQASYAGARQTNLAAAFNPALTNGPAFSREEMTVLTALDGRRAELEERSRRLDEKQGELDRRDREFVARQTQLREMTEALKVDREKHDKRRNSQLDQLANVYGSMDPKEAAALIQQLDVTIALALLERMPEKRIAQILALMNAERALTITRMLSGRAVS